MNTLTSPNVNLVDNINTLSSTTGGTGETFDISVSNISPTTGGTGHSLDIPTQTTEWPNNRWCNDLRSMANTITRLDLWGWLQNENPPANMGYLFWGHPNISRISDGLVHNEHSGSSFACAMRNMQYIAKNGYSKWKSKYYRSRIEE